MAWGDSLLAERQTQASIDATLCSNCGHQRKKHLSGLFECCQLVVRTRNLGSDVMPVLSTGTTVCECEEFEI